MAAVVVVGLVAAGSVVLVAQDRVASLRVEVAALQDRIRELSYNTASGGGVNRKFMPDPATGKLSVALEEVFSFDRHHALCRVDTNPRAFKMKTFSMGEVMVPAGRFFMTMVATTIDQYQVTTRSDGVREVTMRGGLSCMTEVGLATVTVGSRTAAEHATYTIRARDGGVGGGRAGDTFEFTVFFDPKDAPVNYTIFGPKYTFTGEMIEGEVSIVDPKR